MLTRLGHGRLASACNKRALCRSIHFAYDADRLCFSTLGRKIEWMWENPLVCIEADEVRGEFMLRAVTRAVFLTIQG
jgi:nitroimidazol reductase NimA-like FMN-containing flavoprotein (pyridoxamine 5'-phosphate oxidase superfamily)